MLFHIAKRLTEKFGPFRLLTSYAVLIALVLYFGFFLTSFFLPRCYGRLPRDRGREFTDHAKDALGKPTGAGFVFVSIFVISCLAFIPMTAAQISILALTWLEMLTGFLDDRSEKGWGEYRKALLDLIICIPAALALCFLRSGGEIKFWLPLITGEVSVSPLFFIPFCTVSLWLMINVTNCSDGVDGLSATQLLISFITLGLLLYAVLGHSVIASYLLVPPVADGASWAAMTFALTGVLLAYLWRNAFPSQVLMGDAGSRALGFFTGCAVFATGNPFVVLATSSVIIANGGGGLVKIFLLRFFKIKVFSKIRFPLHDYFRKSRGWNANQVMVKFLILQVLVTLGVSGLILKVR